MGLGTGRDQQGRGHLGKDIGEAVPRDWAEEPYKKTKKKMEMMKIKISNNNNNNNNNLTNEAAGQTLQWDF